MADQYDEKYTQSSSPGRDAQGDPSWKVKALFIYPIKSCGHVELDHSDVLRTGLAYDRQFAFAQLISPKPEQQSDGTWTVAHRWETVTIRGLARMTQVKTEVWIPDPKSSTYSSDAKYVKSQGCIVVKFPFVPDLDFSIEGFQNWCTLMAAKVAARSFSAEPMVTFRVPFMPTKPYPMEKMKIWRENPESLNMESEIGLENLAKLRYFLGLSNPLTLFRVDPANFRKLYKCAPRETEVGYQPVVGFSDSVCKNQKSP